MVTTRKCKICGITFSNTQRCLICGPCSYIKYNKGKYNYSYHKRLRQGNAQLKKSMPSEKECYKFISECIDRKFMIDIKGLLYLIDCYEILGGNTLILDSYSSGEQFTMMWNYCYKKFNEAYPHIKIEIM